MTNSTNAQTSLVTRHLAGLFNGISQQAPTIRLENQAENQVNGWSSLIDGLCTRPPTRYIATPFSTGADTDLYHSINRDEIERYILKIKQGGEIEVSDSKGIQYPLEYDDKSKEYISSSNPKKELTLTTIADYTFIANKTKIPEVIEADEISQSSAKAILTLTLSLTYRIVNGGGLSQNINTLRNQGYSVEYYRSVADPSGGSDIPQYKVYYSPPLSLSIDGVSVAIISEQVSLSNTMNALIAKINANSAFTCYRVSDSIIRVFKVDGSDFKYNVSGASDAYIPLTSVNRLHYDKIAYIYVSKGVAEQNYSVYINGVRKALYTSGNTNNAGTYKTDVIAESLFNQLFNAGYGVDLTGACVKVFMKNGSDFSIEVNDSWGNAALKCFKGQAQAFTDLPGRCFDGAVLKIVGKADENAGGGYWVRYETYTKSGNIAGSGVWKEYREPLLKHNINAATMPQQLVRRQNINKYRSDKNPLGLYFSLEQTAWANRLVGDDDTAPHPSFIGSNINAMFLYGNRLGILSNTSVSLTKTNEFFNFYPSTVTESLDDEPIDLSISDSNVSNLLHAVPSKDDLLLFSANGQFILNSGEEPLTPKTAIITPILNYPSNQHIEPVVQGSIVYFLGKRGDYYTCREYFAQTNTQGLDATVSNSHCPELLKVNGSKGFLGGIPNENIVFIGGLEPTKLFIYKYEWVGNTKEQASWSVWDFYEPIAYACEFDSELYCVMNSGRLVKLSFIRDDSLALDCLREFEPGEAITTLDSFDEAYNAITGGKVEDLSRTYDFKVAVGRPYKFIYEFSPIFLKLDNSQVGSLEVATPLRRVRLYLKGLCDFNLTIKNKRQGKDVVVYKYHTPTTSEKLYEKSFILRGDAKRTGIEIASTSVKPINLQSASFEILANLLVKPI
ncbi:phage nozzle protein [Campylobacter hyointestinalis]|uniref:phage nozzle protein n=1 Tax=Campylobacter hyointestinalis TaxID=198 RepID=UPI000CE55F0E|nr:hypothetical protein [Campylobacter hyointestinalis]PPB55977.1 hypothetical protein CDQ67_01700 [Campylobacter hyointestinalis subsp. hyointestinalis]